MKNYCNAIPSPKQLNLVVALACEARPIIDFFQLKKIPTVAPFPLYCNQDRSMALVVSGIGAIKAAAAVSYLQLFTGEHDYACYLNIGIAGGREYQVGDCVIAHKIHDAVTAKSWYPSTFYLPTITQATLTTFPKPQTTLPPTGIVDMEAAGVWQAACLHVTQEQVQVLKIISDYDAATQAQITKTKVTELIQSRLPEITAVVKALWQLSSTEAKQRIDPHLLTAFSKRWHFSRYQLHELNELLRRWQALHAEANIWEICADLRSAKEVLITLSVALQAV